MISRVSNAVHCKTAIVTKLSDEVNVILFSIKTALLSEWHEEEMVTDINFFLSVLLPSLCIYRNRIFLLIRGFALLKYAFGVCIFLND